MRAGENWTPRFAMFGDMGNSFGISIPPLQVSVGEIDPFPWIELFGTRKSDNESGVGAVMIGDGVRRVFTRPRHVMREGLSLSVNSLRWRPGEEISTRYSITAISLTICHKMEAVLVMPT